MDGSTRSSEYKKVNPKGRVPFLNTGEQKISEVSAIMTYLALTNPESNLIANTPIGMARTIEWTNWLAGIHTFIIAQNWRTERFSDDIKDHKNIQKKGMENLKNTYQQIDGMLVNSPWAVGDHYSIADPYLLVFFRWGNRLGLEMAEFRNWNRHAEQMERRAAVEAVLVAENISIWE